MQTIDFTKGIGYEIINFPDGEKHLKIKELDRKDTVEIICRITNSDDLFLLMQLSDILNRQCICVERITIPYLMTMRCDRLFSFEQPFSLRIVADIINSFNAKEVEIIEPHSKRCLDLIKNSKGVYAYKELFGRSKTVCYPDKGAFIRYTTNMFLRPYIVCSKVRDVDTGKLISFKIDEVNADEVEDVTVIDDLCDGGGTFIGIAELLRKELNPKSLTLAVTHAVQKGGIEKGAKVYDKVIITNSYKDWQNEDLPDNVEVKIIE